MLPAPELEDEVVRTAPRTAAPAPEWGWTTRNAPGFALRERLDGRAGLAGRAAPAVLQGHAMNAVRAREHRPHFQFLHPMIFQQKQPTNNWPFHRSSL